MDFKIHVPDSALSRLHQKLALTDLPDDDADSPPWLRGTLLTEVSRLLKYWRDGYDWREAERQLNEFPQQLVEVDVKGYGTLKVHCIHRRSEVSNAIPLIFLHGWPGSFIEVTKMLGALVQAGDEEGEVAFHVVAPSLVNFGFSDGVTKAGFNTEKHAEAMHKLMLKLGYQQYVAQGGDIGYVVSRFLARQYPQSCRAHHINMVAALEPDASKFPAIATALETYSPTPLEAAALARTQTFHADGMAYAQLHATRPQTLAYALRDSSVGLLAWIAEKLHAWTDGYPWTDDEVLTWVSIYWFAAAGPQASVRFYREGLADFRTAAEYVPGAKLGVSRFPMDIIHMPGPWVGTLGQVVFERWHERGGHFAAWECPEALVADLKVMFGKEGGAFGCVDGCGT